MQTKRTRRTPVGGTGRVLGFEPDGCPILAATRVAGRTADQLRVRCPFCGRDHLHGAASKGGPRGSGDGYRVAECFGGDYRIREVA